MHFLAIQARSAIASFNKIKSSNGGRKILFWFCFLIPIYESSMKLKHTLFTNFLKKLQYLNDLKTRDINRLSSSSNSLIANPSAQEISRPKESFVAKVPVQGHLQNTTHENTRCYKIQKSISNQFCKQREINCLLYTWQKSRLLLSLCDK